MNLQRFIDRPVLSTVISVMMVLLGILGITTLPVIQYPDTAPPTVQVEATYTGANAQAVLNSVIVPLEEQINGVENMLYMTSTAANNGTATIQVYFKQGTDPDMAAVNVQNRVSMAQGLLPSEVTQVGVITEKRQSSMLIVYALYDEDNKYSTDFLENYANINLVPELKRVNGVGGVQAFGADYSMRIWLRPDVMAQYGLAPSDVAAVLAEQNIEAAPGQFGERNGQTFQYTLRYKGRLQNESEFEQLVVKSLDDGEVLRLGDIARVELGRLTYGFISENNGKRAVAGSVNQMAGSNATQTIKDLEVVLKAAEEKMPPGMKIKMIVNANDFLYASINNVVKTLLEAFVLVFLVVFIFLQDFRSTLVPMIAIPVSLIGTFFVLSLIGFSINLLTLSAMVLAIAIVVDDAIVVVEGVHAKLDLGYTSARKASIDAMNELGGAIVSITLIMMAVFVPVSFMSGTAGVFYRQFGLTMAIAVGLSAINALTLSPALCALFLKPHKKGEHGEEEKKKGFFGRFFYWFNTHYSSLEQSYKKRVVWFVHKKWASFGLVGLTIVGLIYFMQTTPSGMVPTEDTGSIMGTVTLPPGTSQDRAEEIFRRVDSLIAADPAVDSRTMISGFGLISGQGPSYASFFIRLKNWEERSLTQNAKIVSGTLFMRAQKVVKDAQVLFFQPPMITGFSMTSDIELNMQDKTGGSLEKFNEVINSYIAELQKRPEINSASTSFDPSFPQYLVDVDAAACKRAGISPSTILSTMQGYLGGMYVSNFNSYGKMYRVMLQGEREFSKNEESLKSIKVKNNNGEMAPISQFVSLQRVYGPDIINRFNLFTSIKVMVSPASGYTSGQALTAISEVSKSSLPTGYDYELGGMAREEASTGSNTAIIFGLCLVFVYLLLSAQYESYLLPLAVLLSIPAGLLGSFLFVNGFAALGSIPALSMILGTMSNDIYMQIALIMLIGLTAKNAILIVEFAIERRRMGMSIASAGVLGAAARLRPILMTALAMIVGMLPMMFSGVFSLAAGAQGNRTLGASTVGGMLIGLIVQILVVPALFVVFQWLQEKIKPVTLDTLEDTEVSSDLEEYSPSNV